MTNGQEFVKKIGEDWATCNFAIFPCSGSLPVAVASKAKSVPPAPARFINRELSWLEFNQRVLNEALDTGNPLLERVKFFCIVSSNLDEFFEVRVAGLKQQMESDVVERSLDGLTASDAFRAITRRVRQMVADQYACWREELMPALARNGIRILDVPELDAADMEWVRNYHEAQVRPGADAARD